MHTPFNPSIYQGRSEPFEDRSAQYWYQHIGAYQDQPICLIGFACDQGVHRNQGRIGAKHAPDVIKSALGKLPIGINLQKHHDDLSSLVGDVGNVACVDGDVIADDLLETAQNHYAQTVSQLVQNGKMVIGIGGGHEIAFASFMGLYQGLSDDKKRIGIINLDAHFDLRSSQYATSGTPFLQIANALQAASKPFDYLAIGISDFANTASLFAKADALGVCVIGEDDCLRLPFGDIQKRMDDFITQVDVLYVTLDLDVLMAAVMPAVSAVNAKGLSLDFVERCLAYLLKTGKVGMMDIAEFNPNYDIDGRGAKVAGRILAGVIEQILLHCPHQKQP